MTVHHIFELLSKWHSFAIGVLFIMSFVFNDYFTVSVFKYWRGHKEEHVFFIIFSIVLTLLAYFIIKRFLVVQPLLGKILFFIFYFCVLISISFHLFSIILYFFRILIKNEMLSILLSVFIINISLLYLCIFYLTTTLLSLSTSPWFIIISTVLGIIITAISIFFGIIDEEYKMIIPFYTFSKDFPDYYSDFEHVTLLLLGWLQFLGLFFLLASIKLIIQYLMVNPKVIIIFLISLLVTTIISFITSFMANAYAKNLWGSGGIIDNTHEWRRYGTNIRIKDATRSDVYEHINGRGSWYKHVKSSIAFFRSFWVIVSVTVPIGFGLYNKLFVLERTELILLVIFSLIISILIPRLIYKKY